MSTLQINQPGNVLLHVLDWPNQHFCQIRPCCVAAQVEPSLTLFPEPSALATQIHVEVFMTIHPIADEIYFSAGLTDRYAASYK